VFTGCSACHSVVITEDGEAYGWGRNETSQLGLGPPSPLIATPTKLTIPNEESLKFVSAGVGKYHTILVAENGNAYAAGGNKCGQLGVNSSVEVCERFRKCSVVGQVIVQASCGENISALISSTGQLYTTGSSEFGQLGNGETGEYIISAGKLGFANCSKFIRRSVFVQSEGDAAIEKGDCICIGSVACGRNHLIAIEAQSTSGEVPRVFTWGCGDYGCLGHAVQADEYTPRLVGVMRGPIFASNHPVAAVAGSNCTLIRTKNGHVYYWGKHRQMGEATMRPTLVDALANNGHNVIAFGVGNQTVFCSTANGVTVSWGAGAYGELGYGKGEQKSSAKPKFVNGLDSCLVTDLACGFGHTLFLIRNDDQEDAKALKKVP
ncbi:rcc1-repeat-containing protein, partial [Thalassiosira pseudonana CCMP1335]